MQNTLSYATLLLLNSFVNIYNVRYRCLNPENFGVPNLNNIRKRRSTHKVVKKNDRRRKKTC